MGTFQVTCIKKQDRFSTHEGITHFGGPAGGGWRRTRDEVIQMIEQQGDAFYTEVNGKRAYVGVVREPGKRPYLRTHADGYWNDNLLALTECWP